MYYTSSVYKRIKCTIINDHSQTNHYIKILCIYNLVLLYYFLTHFYQARKYQTVCMFRMHYYNLFIEKIGII